MKHWTPVAFVIAGCFFLVYPAAAPGGYTFSPLDDPLPGGGHDFTEITFWDLPPHAMLINLLLFLSPVLLFPAELYYSFTIMLLLGYRRISRKDLLDHASRKRLYECIVESPGISIGDLIRIAGITRGAAQYHLWRLESVGMIVATRRGGRRGYFRTGALPGVVDRKVCLHLKDGTDRRILLLLLKNRCFSQQDLALAVGISPPSTFWHMRRLIADGIVEPHREGKMMRYLLTPEAADSLRGEVKCDGKTTAGTDV
ncbi:MULTISPECIES: winged helix-turn-helix transcriptional regulator [unclassified Methanoculleus]|jgi:predicted transcriptional regulator|uniref:winged helix-turn-helix transcriptional regulator n=1 Tax=unclassified Methanoculleus TaxID=2619537 RepID=UPI00260042BD|nr:winged helix-turn-helix transcriptional regulator [Methanoculleus sp. UBA377]MDD2472578.1 winged helix-turn-helix transcriptional regulator [Methanoculleus sp.]